MGELIAILGMIKDAPTGFTLSLAIIAVGIVAIIKLRGSDVESVTSLSKAQNEKLMALMNQNKQLLDSVSELQSQVHTLHKQMNEEAEEHRKKLEQTYKIVDEMRDRITELEDLVRIYQKKQDNVCTFVSCPNRKKE